MDQQTLLEKIKEANSIEESFIRVLTQIVDFYLKGKFSVEFDPELKKEFITHIETLKNDSEKHRHILQNIKVYVESGGKHVF